MQIFTPKTNLSFIVAHVRARGYYYEADILTSEVITGLVEESKKLNFELGDHVNHPINKKKKTEVQQLHERVYTVLDDPQVPFSSQVCHQLSELFAPLDWQLGSWLPNEIGYQRYRGQKDWISPHRDRQSDQFFSLTFTLLGEGVLNFYTPLTDPTDYRKLRQVDSFLTRPGTVMFLRAPGFGDGEQIIHEVSPPLKGERLILNLRMRASILPDPKKTYYE
jgi:hypothetical protein